MVKSRFGKNGEILIRDEHYSLVVEEYASGAPMERKTIRLMVRSANQVPLQGDVSVVLETISSDRSENKEKRHVLSERSFPTDTRQRINVLVDLLCGDERHIPDPLVELTQRWQATTRELNW